MLKIHLLSWLFMGLITLSFGQTILEHEVVDENGEPIPFVHVSMEGSSGGTVANRYGKFRLRITAGNEQSSIIISAIGYQSKKLQGGRIPRKIVLQEDVIQLQGVVVVPRDYARELVQQAIQNIPKNYPNEKELLIGFLRETTYWQHEGPKKPLYVAESVIESVKESYQNKHIKGVTRLVEGRNYTGDGLEKLSTRIYAGAHHPHRFDAVMKRDEFLTHPKHFDFELTDTLRYKGKDVFEVHFTGKRDRPQGKLYIEDVTFAISKISFHYDRFPLMDDDRLLLDYEAIYQKGDDEKWRISRTSYFTKFQKAEGELVLASDYISTDHENQPPEIPYMERIHFRDYLLYETQDYNPDFWSNYNILLGDPEIEHLFAGQANETGEGDSGPGKKLASKRTGPPLLRFLERFRSNIGLTYAQLDIDAHTVNFVNNALDLDQQQPARTIPSLQLSAGLQYRLSDNFYLGYRSTIPLTKGQVRNTEIELQRQFNLNPNKRPIFFIPRVGVSFAGLQYLLEVFDPTVTFDVNNKTFDSGRTKVSLRQNITRLMGGAALGIELGGNIILYSEFSNYHTLSEKQGLYFEERNESFNPNRYFLKNGVEGLNLGASTPLRSNYQVSVGFLRSF